MSGDVIDIELSGKSYVMRVNGIALELASELLKADPLVKLFGDSTRAGEPLHAAVIFRCATAAIYGGGAKKFDVRHVREAIDKEPGKFLELQGKTVDAFRRYFVALGLLEAPVGEEQAREESAGT